MRLASLVAGLAVYNPQVWFNPKCNYAIDEPSLKLQQVLDKYSNDKGEVCEHVILHMCLKGLEDENGREMGLKIGIQPDMQLSRSANIGGWNNPTAIYFALFALLSGCSIMALRKRFWRTEGRTTYNFLAKKLRHKNSEDYPVKKSSGRRKKFQSMPNLQKLMPDSNV